MGLSRRLFLKLAVLAALVFDAVPLFISRLFAAPVPLPSHPYRETLASFMDTLLPADDTPSATQLAVTDRLLGLTDKNPRLDRLMTRGCGWLDDQARKKAGTSFSALNEAARNRIVSLAAHSPPQSDPRLFFDQLRMNGFSLYYGHPQNWVSLEYNGPPQPRGFPEYTQAPKPRR